MYGLTGAVGLMVTVQEKTAVLSGIVLTEQLTHVVDGVRRNRTQKKLYILEWVRFTRDTVVLQDNTQILGLIWIQAGLLIELLKI